jgi:hydroxyacylglutathione hydrolase
MKRLLIFAGISILLLLLTAAVIAESAFMGWQARRQTIADGVEIDGIRIVKDGMVTIAVVPNDANEVALIDAGSDASGKAILAELSRRHLGPEAVTAILLTHGHRDHTASIHLFGKARVMVLEPDVALVEGMMATRSRWDMSPSASLPCLATRREAPLIWSTACCSLGTPPTCTTTER